MPISSSPLFIHIGYPKTASTFFQSEVFPLLTSVNYLNPFIMNSLSKIVWQEELSFNQLEIYNSINQHLNPNIPNLISFELLCGDPNIKSINNTLIANRLKKLFPQAIIIIVIRNQLSLIESLYAQKIQSGSTKTFEEFINYKKGYLINSYNGVDGSVNLETLHYEKLINYYQNLFGADNIKLLIFEKIHNNLTDFIQDFLSILKVKKEDLTRYYSLKHVNQSYRYYQILIARFLNRLVKKPVLKEHGLFPDILIPKIGRLNSRLIRRILQSRISFKILKNKPLVIPFHLKQDIKNYYTNSNLSLDNQYKLNLYKTYRKYYF